MTGDNQSDESARSVTQIRLYEGDHVIMVTPRCEDEDPAPSSFDAFELPQLPRSLSDWLLALCQRFWQQHQRCLSAVLLLDAQSHSWGTAVPMQECSRDSSHWSLRHDDVSCLPDGQLLAGSFQWRILSRGEEPADAVPPMDGVHLILLLQSKANVLTPFLRMGGKVQAAPVARVFLDDWEQILNAIQSRVSLL